MHTSGNLVIISSRTVSFLLIEGFIPWNVPLGPRKLLNLTPEGRGILLFGTLELWLPIDSLAGVQSDIKDRLPRKPPATVCGRLG